MSNDFDSIVKRSVALRKKYHELEIQHHNSEWTIEEDALAYLTDAGLVGRNIMSQEGRWPKINSKEELEHKLGENIWWLIVLAERLGIDIKEATERFLTRTEQLL
ncbi:MazG-like protein [Flavobacterium beibuense]|uniref:30S ribosomal protein S15 n=1 Tax=Flavobacterium beibuense TaxID=657326 RepID=A0A444W939_9FLAO|nr:MazG-like protein [Flavobacterium beibuense]RYJ42399.1 30S ribosomal protein S15 [Flavobacterium beibuense]